MLFIFSLVGLVLVLLSFATWSAPLKRGFKETPDSYKTGRGIAFGLWTLALPAYSLWEWYFTLNQHIPNAPAEFQYEHQVWSNVWSAVAVLLGVLFGIRK